ncbi:uncharacterized protein LOC134012024 [Osmerus eperlanus]|uniref:uncharacterized protein LOC134012024 n=1 Tax=Osmerus eperlanus TaxID=29151 RepID=UPI002E10F31A
MRIVIFFIFLIGVIFPLLQQVQGRPYHLRQPLWPSAPRPLPQMDRNADSDDYTPTFYFEDPPKPRPPTQPQPKLPGPVRPPGPFVPPNKGLLPPFEGAVAPPCAGGNCDFLPQPCLTPDPGTPVQGGDLPLVFVFRASDKEQPQVFFLPQVPGGRGQGTALKPPSTPYLAFPGGAGVDTEGGVAGGFQGPLFVSPAEVASGLDLGKQQREVLDTFLGNGTGSGVSQIIIYPGLFIPVPEGGQSGSGAQFPIDPTMTFQERVEPSILGFQGREN